MYKAKSCEVADLSAGSDRSADVEAFLQCFGAAEKSMNRKNNKSDWLRNSDLS